MKLIEALLEELPAARVLDIRLGQHWIAVVAEIQGLRKCGLAASVLPRHAHRSEPDVPLAGELERLTMLELAAFLRSDNPILASIGLATVNALLPAPFAGSPGMNAEEMIAARGAGKKVVLVGHFPFVPRLRPAVGELVVLEQNPGSDDLPAENAPDVLPGAQVVAITAMTLINHTLEDLLAHCPSQSTVLLLGPSTPLSQRLFDFGIDILCGVEVTAIDPVVRVVSQGGNFHQVHQAGTRLVNMFRTEV
jgi:uncharacterized protein (DUF4213/DUF364 family)